MHAVEADASNRLATVGAGAILHKVQDKVAEAGLSFPLYLSARGNPIIGGLIACNSVGKKTLRLGTMREQVQGLEVVLPGGRETALMSAMIKNNTG